MSTVLYVPRFNSWIVLLLVLLLSSFQGVAQNAPDGSAYFSSDSKSKGSIRIDNGKQKYVVKYEGLITLADDDRDVVDISKGGFIDISKSAFGSKRRILIKAKKDGGLSREYFVGRSKKSYEPEGKAWLGEVLLEVIRNSTMGAESRVNRFYQKGGVDAVLAEINVLESDHVAATYYDALLEKEIRDSELEKIIRSAGQGLRADHYLSSFLKENQGRFFSTRASVSAFIQTAKEIDTDHYKADIVKKIVRKEKLSDEQFTALIDLTQDIDVDHYQANILKEMLEHVEMNPRNLEQIIQTSRNIDADHHQAQVLREILKEEKVSGGNIELLLDALEDIHSDNSTAQVAQELLEEKMDDASLGKFLKTIKKSVASDHFLKVLLVKVVETQDLKGKSMGTFLDAVKHIGTDHYTMQVLKTLALEDNFTDSQLIDILKTCKRLSVDNYKAHTLIEFAERTNKAGSDAKKTYRAVAKDIGTEVYYGKALRPIDE